MRSYQAALIQLDSRDDKAANLAAAKELVERAAGRGARLIALPETMNFIGRGYSKQAEPIPGGETCELFRELAQKHGVWIETGSIPQAMPDGGSPRNTAMLIDPTGRVVCTYSKLHMFDVDITNGPSYHESAHNAAGDEIVLADTELGMLGFSVCYDLRFPELCRLMAMHGAQVILVPTSFTMNTGKDHWEPLMRARAIENGVYMLGPSQIGQKTGMNAYGKSLAVDPWGNVIAKASGRPGITLVDIDLDLIDQTREQVPSLARRRDDLYRLDSDRVKIYR